MCLFRLNLNNRQRYRDSTFNDNVSGSLNNASGNFMRESKTMIESNSLSETSEIREMTLISPYKGIEGKIRTTYLEGIEIKHRKGVVKDKLALDVSQDSSYFKMQFELTGYLHYVPQNKDSLDVLVRAGEHQLFYFPQVKGYLDYPQKVERNALEIILSTEFVQQNFREGLYHLPYLNKSLMEAKPLILYPNALPITPTMQNLILDIIYCQYQGLLKKVYLKNKVIELLILQTEQVKNSTSSKNHKLSKEDIEKLHYVKELIVSDIRKHYPIQELAKLAGLNSFKLKTGFKSLFGSTIFGFLTNYRMEKAKVLLQKSSQSIAEISFIVGYQNPQHFTVAFKKFFGFLPSTYR